MAEHVTGTEGGNENYFISMTDLMVGLLLIFIVLLMFFALQFKETINEQETIRDARAGILSNVQKMMEEAGVTVLLDVEQGLVRLPESVLFESGQATLNERGRHAIEVLAARLQQALPCYTKGPARREACPEDSPMVDAILIEGHTDDVPVRFGRRWRDNLELSTFRATNTYRALLEASEENGNASLLDFKNAADVPVLSVSGYGEHRPISDEEKAPNRRIDLRFLMAPAEATAQAFLDEDFLVGQEASD